MIRYRQSSSCGTSWRLGVHIGACVLTAPRGWFARGHAPQEFGCLVTWWAPGPQIEASPVVMGASAWRSCLEFLSLGRFLSCYCVKSRCPASVEINTIPQVILKIPQSINDGVDWANYSLRT